MAEKEVIITYDTLFDLARREKFRAELQKVDERFFDDVIRYFSEKQSIIESQEKNKSVFAAAELEKTRNQLREAKRLLKEIYTWRETKIVQGAIFQSRCNGKGFDFSALLPEEALMFNSLQAALLVHREKILHALLNHEKPNLCIKAPCTQAVSQPKDLKATPNTKEGSVCIEFKCNLPEFMGPDMKKYGPYKAGDKAEMPEQAAEMLVKSGNAFRAEGKFGDEH